MEDSSIVSQTNTNLTFLNLCYDVKVKKKSKTILKGISGTVDSGEILAIIGASGAGKSSLLNLLAGRIPKGTKVSGQILVNNKSIKLSKFKNISSYVLQDDIIYTFQTVKETIKFSADLRCPAGFTKKEVLQRCEEVINQLGLTNCQETIIGNQFKKGISGGERKRVCIGVEIVRNVPILFLDEPTTGLDSFMAYNVIHHLKDLSVKNNKITIFTIHQPRSNIFELFDKLLILSCGETVYFGDSKKAINYFSSLDFVCPERFNFTDYVLDISAPDYRSKEKEENSIKRIKMLHSNWKKIDEKNNYKSKIFDNVTENKRRKSNFLVQFPVVFKRQLKEDFRNWLIIVTNIVQNVFIALIIGGIYFKGKNTTLSLEQIIQNYSGLLFFLCLNQSIGPIFQVINTYFISKAVFMREYEAGFYSSIAFYLSNLISVSILQPVYTLIFIGIIYPMAKLREGLYYFMILYSDLLLSKLVAMSLGLLISASFSKIQYAQIVAPVILILNVLLSGLYINLETISPVFRPFQHLSFFKYSYQIAMQNQFQGFEINGIEGSGDSVLKLRSISADSFALSYSILSIMLIIAFIFGSFMLWRGTPKYQKIKLSKTVQTDRLS